MRTRPAKPKLSLIIPVYNEERYIAAALAAWQAQDASPDDFEVLIYDGGSLDRTRQIALEWRARFRHFTVVDNPGKLPAAARNRGVHAARGEIIAFVEGHCLPPTSYVTRVLALFESTNADALGRPIDLVVPHSPRQQQAIGIARMSSLGHARSSLLYSKAEGYCSSVSCATIYRKTVLEQLGEFDENLPVAEDVDFNLRFERAGLVHYFSQDLGCLYYPRRTYRKFFRQMYGYGLGRTRSAMGRGWVSLSDSAPLVVIGLTLMSLVAGFYWLPLSLLGLGYFAIILSYAFGLVFSQQKISLWPHVVVAIWVIHFGMATGQIGGLWEWCQNKLNPLEMVSLASCEARPSSPSPELSKQSVEVDAS